MPAASHAVAAVATDDVTFAADDVARGKVVHVGTNFDNLADELMAHDHRHGDRLLLVRIRGLGR